MSRILWWKFLALASLRNLLRNPRRTIISLLAIACAAAAMLIFQSFTNGVKKTFRHNVITSDFGHFQIFQKGYRDNTDDEDPYRFQMNNDAEIRVAIEKAVSPISFFSLRQPFYGLLNFNDKSIGGRGYGVDAAEEKKFLTLMHVHEGRHLADSGTESIFMGYALARKLHAKIGDVITVLTSTSTGSINAADLELTGTFMTTITDIDEGLFYIHRAVAGRLLKTTGAPQIMIGFDTQDETKYIGPLEDLFQKKFPNLEAVHWMVLAPFFQNTMGWVESLVGVFRIVILIIATISIITVFMMGLFERIGEFGTLRAIGTGRGDIVGMIVLESIIQALLGSVLGLALGVLAITVFLRMGVVMPPPPMMSVPFHVKFEIPWDDMVNVMLLCITVAGGAGIIPAARMARINVVEALGRNV